jgi:hypothetical protein
MKNNFFKMTIATAFMLSYNTLSSQKTLSIDSVFTIKEHITYGSPKTFAVPSDKVWKIEFSSFINNSAVGYTRINGIYVDMTNQKQPIWLNSKDSLTINQISNYNGSVDFFFSILQFKL